MKRHDLSRNAFATWRKNVEVIILFALKFFFVKPFNLNFFFTKKKRKLRGKGNSFEFTSHQAPNLIDKIKLQLEKEKTEGEIKNKTNDATTEATITNDSKSISSSLKPDTLLLKKKLPSVKKTIRFES